MAAVARSIGTRTFPALGTLASVLVTEPDQLDRAAGLLDAELRAMDHACSRFRNDAELWRVNHADGRPVQVSPLLAEALATALMVAAATDGDVDLTCGEALARLGYDRDFAVARQDTSALTEPPVPAAGWRTVELDQAMGVVRVPAGVMLDLGATAKALAADRAAVAIAATTGCGVLVNLGGDIRVAGQPPPGGWRVGIRDDVEFTPDDSDREPSQAIVISDSGLATSSTGVRSWQRGGTRLHHIIVPGTGLPVESCWRAASVTAATCVDANAASTAAILRGEAAPEWLDRLRLPARLVHHDGTTVTTSGWPADPASAAGSTA
jgi:thiamine biosynthesis lipoprotein ApbE